MVPPGARGAAIIVRRGDQVNRRGAGDRSWPLSLMVISSHRRRDMIHNRARSHCQCCESRAVSSSRRRSRGRTHGPLWYEVNLRGQSFKSALGDSMFREQYIDAVAAVINAQEAAGLDIVTDGDSRFDLAVGGKSWFFYPIERLGGLEGHRDTSRGWMSAPRPASRQDPLGSAGGLSTGGRQAAADPRPARVHRAVEGGPAPDRQARQVRHDLRTGARRACCGTSTTATTARSSTTSRDIMNAELRELAAAGCPLIQVEEPPAPRPHDTARLHRRRARVPDRGVQPSARRRRRGDLGRTRAGAIRTSSACTGRRRATSARCPTCSQLDADVITFECASTDGRDLPLFAKHRTDKKIGIGVISHCNTVVEPPEHVAAADPEGARVHPARAAGRHHRLWIRPRGAEPAHRLLQVRRARRGHQHRPPRAGPPGSARARVRSRPLLRELAPADVAPLHVQRSRVNHRQE